MSMFSTTLGKYIKSLKLLGGGGERERGREGEVLVGRGIVIHSTKFPE